MKNIVWIAVNSVKPDLPAGTIGKKLWFDSKGNAVVSHTYVCLTGPSSWVDVICYALKPTDPVQELVNAAKEVDNYYKFGRLHDAIKAVEDTFYE
jgi:hypothetical protein